MCSMWSVVWKAVLPKLGFVRPERAITFTRHIPMGLSITNLSEEHLCIGIGKFELSSYVEPGKLTVWNLHSVGSNVPNASCLQFQTPVTGMGLSEGPHALPSMDWPTALAYTGEHLYVACTTTDEQHPGAMLYKILNTTSHTHFTTGTLIAQAHVAPGWDGNGWDDYGWDGTIENQERCCLTSVAVVGQHLFICDTLHPARRVLRANLDLGAIVPFAAEILHAPYAVVEFEGLLCVADVKVGLLLLNCDGTLKRTLVAKEQFCALFDKPPISSICMTTLGSRLYVLLNCGYDPWNTPPWEFDEHLADSAVVTDLLVFDETGRLLQSALDLRSIASPLDSDRRRRRYSPDIYSYGRHISDICATSAGIYLTNFFVPSPDEWHTNRSAEKGLVFVPTVTKAAEPAWQLANGFAHLT